MPSPRDVRTLMVALAATVALALPLAAQDEPVDLGSGDVGETESPLKVTGFGVLNYMYDGKTGENSFAGNKLAVGFLREITDNAYIYGQLTTAVSVDEASGEVTTETEIDNLILSFTPPGFPDLNLSGGRLDVPVGFERDDEPLLFNATPSFNFEMARPAKMTGLVATWSAARSVQLSGLVFNGWDSELDPNKGKTGGIRAEFLPSEKLDIGLNALYGNEGDQGATNQRLLLNLDYAFQPSWDWIVAGEANYGKDFDIAGVGDQKWTGGLITVVHLFDRHWGVAARAEVLDDPDGARTGMPQTLESYTLTPLYSVGVGREGIFANVPHTRFRIPRLQIRAEVRLNHSSELFFPTDTGLSRWGVQLALQAVTTF